jgi:hypothetical protein
LMIAGHASHSFPLNASLRSGDQLRVQRDSGVENLGHRTVFLDLAGDASKCGVDKIWHLGAQGQC